MLFGIVMSFIKLVKVFVLVILFVGFIGFFVFFGIFGGIIGYGVKLFFGYLCIKDKY